MRPIVVAGSLNVDLVARVPHLPSPGETVIASAFNTFTGGKGANQAVAAARLGGEVSMVGAVGEDKYGKLLLDTLAANNIDARGVVRTPETPTGIALISIDLAGQNIITVVPGANQFLDAERVLSKLPADSESIVILQLEIPLVIASQLCREASRLGARVLLNAAPAAKEITTAFPFVDTLVVNEVEAAQLFQSDVRTPSDAMAAARSAVNGEGPRVAIITLGPAGAVFCERHSSPKHLPAFSVEAVDSTAAGDAFVGAIALALSRGWMTEDAVRFANAAGAASTTRQGAQASLPALEDVTRLTPAPS